MEKEDKFFNLITWPMQGSFHFQSLDKENFAISYWTTAWCLIHDFFLRGTIWSSYGLTLVRIPSVLGHFNFGNTTDIGFMTDMKPFFDLLVCFNWLREWTNLYFLPSHCSSKVRA